ncbi:hypothetical protein E2C01_054950 [Portunus trituberculatus]|uniref:Uncharacterized protein n=1 Tax=Portunus trituberculatus TaxID=210409 RepID=A0A5B7GL58_PORTR|nr:hypothetical protein [Portunus trituberculatus]
MEEYIARFGATKYSSLSLRPCDRALTHFEEGHQDAGGGGNDPGSEEHSSEGEQAQKMKQRSEDGTDAAPPGHVQFHVQRQQHGSCYSV